MQRDLFYQLLDAEIQEPKSILIVTHVNPDGDAIGSSLAFSAFLKQFGHEVNVLVSNMFPDFLAWLPGASEIVIYEKRSDQVKSLFEHVDCIFMLDFNQFSRCGRFSELLEASTARKILIDHHRDTDFEPFYCYLSETQISSTSELVAEIVFHYGLEYLNSDMATNLLAGIITDTGSFAHSIYRPETFALCAKLIEKSAPYVWIHQQIYDTFSESRLRLLGFSISDRMEILDDFATAIIALSKSDLEQFDFKTGDTEGVVNYPLSMKKIKMSVLVMERQDVIRFSFRSKGDFSVHELAMKHFAGGGHTNAAGGSLNCSLQEAVEQLKSVLPAYKSMLIEDK